MLPIRAVSYSFVRGIPCTYIFKHQTKLSLTQHLRSSLGCDEAIEVASHEVARYEAWIQHEKFGQVGARIGYGYCEVVEGIGQAVREAAVDEEGHTEE